PRARRAPLAKIGAVLDHDLRGGRHVIADLNAPVEQPLAERQAALGEAAIVEHPHGARVAVITFDHAHRDEAAAWQDLLHDLDLRLFAEIAKLVRGVAGAAAHIDAALFRDPVA